MKTLLITIPLLLLIFSSCQLEGQKGEEQVGEKQEYLRWVGDIEENAQIDELDFKACNGDDQIFQYFNLGQGPVYWEEKSSTLNTFKSKYKPVIKKGQSGFVRIRFVVNCEGKAGRFRLLQSDYNYQETKFDDRIITQLEDITRGIEKWQVLYKDEIPIDYYFYLIFKITDGEITEILP